MKAYQKSHVIRIARSAVSIFLSFMMVLLLIPTDAFAASERTEETVATYSEDELIIVYEDDTLELDDPLEVTDTDLADEGEDITLSDVGITAQEEIASSSNELGTVVLASIEGDMTVEEAAELLSEDPNIDYVQPNYTYEILQTETSDPYAAEDGSQYYLYDSYFTEAWDSVKTEGAVTIAVIDTGCNLLHEDLLDTVDAAHAYDVTTDTLLASSGTANNGDADGHGTMTAGVIAASADNSLGIAGASYNATVLPIKVFDSENMCSTADILEAYAYLDSLISSGEVTNLRIINMSLGYYASGESEEDTALRSVIADMLNNNGVLTVCAGGNSGAGTGTYCYPADFDECVSVTAADATGANASFSDYNAAKDITAYGTDICTTSADGGYTTGSGTSLAAPQVSAAAALLWTADASLTASEVISILESTADEVTGNVHEESGSAGILNAAAAVATVTGVSDDGSDENSASTEEESTDDTDVSSGEESDESDSFLEEEAADETVSDSGEEQEESESDTATSDTADDTGSEDSEYTQEEIEALDLANSWRYENGELIEDANTDAANGIETLATYYASWKASCGTSSYLLVNSSSGSSTKVSISNAVRVGIDVSYHNGTIDWEEVKADGVDYAIIRCGYGSDLSSQDDTQFLTNVEGALEAGIEIGIYLYSYATKATGTTSAASEAEHVLRLLDEAGLEPSDLDLPVYYDLEDSTQESLSASTIGDMAETFCEAIEDAGYTPGIYANQYWWTSILTDSRFSSEGWSRWVARYPSTTGITKTTVSDTDMWQFSEKGVVSGISGYADMNFDYIGSGGYTDSVPAQAVISSVTLSSSEDSATVKWAKISNADGYRVYRKEEGESSYTMMKQITSGSTVSWTDTDLNSGTAYSYKVRAYRTTSDGTKVFGAYSSAAYLTTSPDQVTLTSVVMNSNNTRAILTWEEVSRSDGYLIYRKTEDASSYTKVCEITSSSTVTWTDTTMVSGTTYRYKIRAYKTGLNGKNVYGSYSSVSSWVTRKPSQVTGTTVTLQSTLTSAKVKWSALKVADGYEIYRSVDGGSYTFAKRITTGASTTSWTDSSLTKGSTYRYKVRGYVIAADGSRVTGSFSSSQTVTALPDNVTISSAATTSDGYVKVKWQAALGADGYRIYRSVNGGSYSLVKTITNTLALSWTDKTVSSGKVYRYKIKAYTKDGSKTYTSASYSAVKKVTAKPAQVTITSAKNSARREMTVKWQSVSNVTRYQVAYRVKGSSEWKYMTTASTSAVRKKLTSGKTYYVKVRAYKSYQGTKYYGAWSSTKTVAVK